MNLQQLEQQYDAAVTEALTLKSRGVDPDTITAAVTRATDLKARIARVKADAGMVAEIDRLTNGMTIRTASGRGLGAQFIGSDTFKWLKDTKNSRAGVWNSPASEFMAATLTEDSASGGDLVITDYRPGIVPMPTRPTRVADLFAPGVTDSASVTYMKETTYTNASAAVAEGAAKPESTLIFDAITEPVRKIAHWLPVTEEMLEDVATLRSYLDARLRVGVELTEDDQLLNGDGTAPNISGILDRVLAAAIARVAETNADAILAQISAIENAAFLRPDGIVMNPVNWKTILLSKDLGGAYYGGGPLDTPARPTLWGLPVALTSAIAVGTALVGAFKVGGQVFRKGGLRVEVSNSHSDFFIKNLVAIRAEERLALAVYRPSAFGVVTNLT